MSVWPSSSVYGYGLPSIKNAFITMGKTTALPTPAVSMVLKQRDYTGEGLLQVALLPRLQRALIEVPSRLVLRKLFIHSYIYPILEKDATVKAMQL